ncbi:hypothetical protein DXT99_24435 [Pontibacter diazotrophicus]|uniref:Uncharacterized protein n=1 Tax=Pontibacter diazotrophicus TaxID=1400979 RepID=A0A3D8L291_9BACT|nr:hypothetical protein DXT99_24435 [Pontibacter diazotrophicus]
MQVFSGMKNSRQSGIGSEVLAKHQVLPTALQNRVYKPINLFMFYKNQRVLRVGTSGCGALMGRFRYKHQI